MSRSHLIVIAGLFCTISSLEAQPTYSREVSRIIQAKCQLCHRPNDIAPFVLMTYQDASTWAEDIRRVVTERLMPPWKPVPGHGEFRDAYGLSDEERQTIVSWVNAGAPEGDPSELPEPTVTSGEWQLGNPDLVVEMKEPYTPPRGKDTYRCFIVSNPSDQTMYVSAVDVHPGDRKIVHHVIMYIDEKGQAERLDQQDEGPGYNCFGGPGFELSFSSMLGGWAPGSIPRHLPDGIAIQVPRGGRLVMQVHYYAAGRTAEDQTKVALYYSKAPVDRRLFYIPVVNTRFDIPAGNASYEVRANFPVPPLLDAKVIQVFPHMHLLGKQIKLEYVDARRNSRPGIFIDNWDFNWQGFYNYKEPVAIPAFTDIRLSCIFDNSANNPRNPSNPVKNVRWGEGTEDEMCVAFLGVTFDRENLLPFGAQRN
ncbi:MAG: hypothetical protein JNL98_31395 [Bryobacterales bacterium]|nr:hypothetical protein [Bryobacterales bacterium]